MAKELFVAQLRQVRETDMGIMVMPQFYESKMPNGEANNLPWDKFKAKIEPFGTMPLPNSSAEITLSRKHIAWSAEDVNTFVGADQRKIDEIDDLSDSEGSAWLGINFLVAQQLLSPERPETQISIGFNPGEQTIGHHTVVRLHSHIRSIGHPADRERRQPKKLEEFDWFDKLAFIEPFAVIHHDFINAFVTKGGLESALTQPPEANLGYSSLYFKKEDLASRFPEMKELYVGMKHEYAQIEDVFTDKTTDPVSDRYIPRPKIDRQERLAQYLATSGEWLSDQSVAALAYLANNIHTAEPRRKSPRNIDKASTAYTTKGFAGAMSYSFQLESDEVRFDFLPRVVTTAAVTKTISGKDVATVIAKEKDPANGEEHAIIQNYLNEVDGILQGNFAESYQSALQAS